MHAYCWVLGGDFITLYYAKNAHEVICGVFLELYVIDNGSEIQNLC